MSTEAAQHLAEEMVREHGSARNAATVAEITLRRHQPGSEQYQFWNAVLSFIKGGTKAMPDQPNGMPPEPPADMGPGGDEPQEKYGAQILRRIHQDKSILMQEYDEMLGLCEDEQVRAHLEDLLQHCEEQLTKIEEMWEDKYGQEGYPPLEGAMNVKDEEGAEEEMPESGEAEEATSGEEEVPSEEEAFQGSMGEEGEKALRSRKKWHKDDDEMQECGKGVGGAIRGAVAGAVRGATAPFHHARAGVAHNRAATNAAMQGQGREAAGRAARAVGHYAATAAHMNPVVAAGRVAVETARGAYHGAKKDLASALQDHHRKPIAEAREFLNETGSTDQFTDQHRMKAYHHAKSLEDVAEELMGHSHGGPEFPGDLNWLNEEGQELEHGGKGIMDSSPISTIGRAVGLSGGDNENKGIGDVARAAVAAAKPHAAKVAGAVRNAVAAAKPHAAKVGQAMASHPRTTAAAAGAAAAGAGFAAGRASKKDFDEVQHADDQAEVNNPAESLLQAASHLHDLSQTRDFGDEHRQKSLHHAKALEPFLEEAEDEEEVEHPDSNPQDQPEGQPSDMSGELGEKGLLLAGVFATQQRQLAELNKAVNDLAKQMS